MCLINFLFRIDIVVAIVVVVVGGGGGVWRMTLSGEMAAVIVGIRIDVVDVV